MIGISSRVITERFENPKIQELRTIEGLTNLAESIIGEMIVNTDRNLSESIVSSSESIMETVNFSHGFGSRDIHCPKNGDRKNTSFSGKFRADMIGRYASTRMCSLARKRVNAQALFGMKLMNPSGRERLKMHYRSNRPLEDSPEAL
ncbi:hypothetical protein Nepgr_018622 [Nepenthes gracilis]|uniref:Uncharacterized protein n=1 Tax=Nepenthes gracilis TaxID=150966 RepID=A0AAD3STY9_NEPGR|nr:hypothetical protein Nepgr_018622 [Nepenthes gracilis]